MWRKKSATPLTKSHGFYCIDIKTLQSFRNGETVSLKVIQVKGGFIDLLKNANQKALLPLGSSENVTKETFVIYDRADGKPEEIRLDHLIQVILAFCLFSLVHATL